MRKVLALVSSICLFAATLSPAVSADEVSGMDTPLLTVKSVTEYEEVTDPDGLFALAAEQYLAKTPAALNALSEGEAEPVYSLEAVQLCSETEYTDGTVDEEYTKATIQVFDELGEAVDLSAAVTQGTGVSETGTATKNGIVVSINIRYTYRMPSDLVGDVTVRYDSASVVIANNECTTYAKNCTIRCLLNYAYETVPQRTLTKTYSCPVTLNALTYTLTNTTYTAFENPYYAGCCRFSADATVNLLNGVSIYVNTVVDPYKWL